MPPFLVKICGLSTPEAMAVALDAGADMVGLVFHPRSPRYVVPSAAAALAAMARGRATRVALLVDPSDEQVREIAGTVAPDVLQLHGSETPERVGAVRALSGLPVMKAVGIASAADLAGIAAQAAVADHLLLDAKPPRDAAYPGGHGRPFDWALLDGLDPAIPFVLSGGLDPATVAGAIRRVRAGGSAIIGVDVSSGVESAPGIKDAAAIRAFITAARDAARPSGGSMP